MIMRIDATVNFIDNSRVPVQFGKRLNGAALYLETTTIEWQFSNFSKRCDLVVPSSSPVCKISKKEFGISVFVTFMPIVANS